MLLPRVDLEGQGGGVSDPDGVWPGAVSVRGEWEMLSGSGGGRST